MSNSLGTYIYNLYVTQVYNKDTKKNKDVTIATQFFIGLIIVGCIIKLLSNTLSGTPGFSPASGTIWGYLLVLCSILGFIILTVDTTTDITIKQFNSNKYSTDKLSHGWLGYFGNSRSYDYEIYKLRKIKNKFLFKIKKFYLSKKSTK